MSKLREIMAAGMRAAPSFRGKGRVGAAIGRLLTDRNRPEDCVSPVRMWDGTRIYIDVRSDTEKWAYWTGEYDRKMISRLSACLNPGDTVFDVGANVGFYSISLGARMRALSGTVHAFEPVKSNFDRLMSSVALNDLQGTIRGHNLALGNEESEIELHMDSTGNAGTGNAVILNSAIVAEDHLAPNATARLTRLDTYAREQKIEACHIIKIDVEGAEVMFLEGASDFLRTHRPIIYGEFNAYWLKRFGHSLLDAVRIIGPWNYRIFKATESGSFVEVLEPQTGTENILLCAADTPRSTLEKLGVVA